MLYLFLQFLQFHPESNAGITKTLKKSCSYFCTNGLFKGKTIYVSFKKIQQYSIDISKIKCNSGCTCSNLLFQLLNENIITSSQQIMLQQKLENEGCQNDLNVDGNPTGSGVNQNYKPVTNPINQKQPVFRPKYSYGGCFSKGYLKFII